MATPPAAAIDAGTLLGLDRYASRGYPHDAWSVLRRDDPVHRCEGAGFEPFWAITRHADVAFVSKHPERFASGPRLTLFPRDVLPPGVTEAQVLRMLLNLDPPDHGVQRAILARHFTPAALRGLEARVRDLAREIVEPVVARARDAGGETTLDFVEQVAAPLPLFVILELLGAPRADAPALLALSNQVVGLADPEYAHGAEPPVAAFQAWSGLFQYFVGLVADKRRAPGDDLVSRLAASDAGGRPLEDHELLSYCFLLLTAGNETTRNAIAGGLAALAEHGEQWRRLGKDPRLLATAPDELVRWTSPIVYFCRTATEDGVLGGKRIAAGDVVALFYASANRDESVFEAPFSLDVARDPNPHLGFGIGEHFCLGASLARMEIRAAYAEWLAAVEEIALDGPIARLRSSFTGGIKHLPVRLRLRQRTEHRSPLPA
jgi:cholest-4-en-3-one 26-monooxygenase